MSKPNELDLNRLIEEKLENCTGDYPNICQLIQTHAGKSRIAGRIKEIIFQDGIADIDTALANIETELRFTEEE